MSIFEVLTLVALYCPMDMMRFRACRAELLKCTDQYSFLGRYNENVRKCFIGK